MELDTIIIGSGAGGLAAAICLSRAGQKVLVLEQHDVPGGWCHSFTLNGSRFTPGVHYIGLMDEGGSSNILYKGLGVANELVFFRMKEDAYEHCWIGDERFDMPSNFDTLVDSLGERFPDEKKALTKYLKMVRTVSLQLQLIPKMNGFWDAVTIAWRTRYVGKYAFFSLKRVIGWYIKDPLLKRILNIQCGDHGLPPAKASFPLHCAIMEHYFSGGYYPMGGGAAIVKSMTKAIKRYGGEVRTQQRVTRILIEGEEEKRAVGIELKNGKKIYAKRVVSNADPGITYLDLVGEHNLSLKLRDKLNDTKYSSTSLMLFLTVDMDVRAAGLDSGNIWVMPNKNMDDLYDEMMSSDLESGEYFSAMFISCTTLKDPVSFDGKHHVLEVITYINNEAFKKFEKESQNRSDDYLEFKNKLTNKMVNSLDRAIPGIKDKIVYKELGTPLTNKHYINTTEGCVYGTEKSLKHIGPNSYQFQSEIKDLYLCGASVLSHGVAGSGYSGVQAAAKILNCRQDDLIKADETQKLRIYNAEDDSDYPQWMQEKIKMKRNRTAKSKK